MCDHNDLIGLMQRIGLSGSLVIVDSGCFQIAVSQFASCKDDEYKAYAEKSEYATPWIARSSRGLQKCAISAAAQPRAHERTHQNCQVFSYRATGVVYNNNGPG